MIKLLVFLLYFCCWLKIETYMPAVITNEVFFGLLSLILAFYLVLISNLVLLNTYKTTAAFLEKYNQIFNNHHNISLAYNQGLRNGQLSTRAISPNLRNGQTSTQAMSPNLRNGQTSTRAISPNLRNRQLSTRAMSPKE